MPRSPRADPRASPLAAGGTASPEEGKMFVVTQMVRSCVVAAVVFLESEKKGLSRILRTSASSAVFTCTPENTNTEPPPLPPPSHPQLNINQEFQLFDCLDRRALWLEKDLKRPRGMDQSTHTSKPRNCRGRFDAPQEELTRYVVVYMPRRLPCFRVV